MKKHALLTLMPVALATAMLFVSCNNAQDKIDKETKAALKGTWVNVDEGSGYKFENTITFSDSTFETQSTDSYNGISSTSKTKGTYTYSDSLLTMTLTHVWGNTSQGMEAKWYSKAEYKAFIKQQYLSWGQDWGAEEDKLLEEMFAPQTMAIAVSDKTLYIGGEEFTKK